MLKKKQDVACQCSNMTQIALLLQVQSQGAKMLIRVCMVKQSRSCLQCSQVVSKKANDGQKFLNPSTAMSRVTTVPIG